MTGMNGTSGVRAYQNYLTQATEKHLKESPKEVEKQEAASNVNRKKVDYGRTVGEPQLSEEAQKYYEELKKKYGDYQFILVGKDQKDYAMSHASQYAIPNQTVVLIDEEKIERMATDESFRKKYEGILDGAAVQLEQLKARMEQTGAPVKGYGIQVNDGGLTSFFAVLEKSSAAQRERIEKNAKENRQERKEAVKEAYKERYEKHLEEGKLKYGAESKVEDTVSFHANSIEELFKQLDDYYLNQRSDEIETAAEKLIGHHIDFRG